MWMDTCNFYFRPFKTTSHSLMEANRQVGKRVSTTPPKLGLQKVPRSLQILSLKICQHKGDIWHSNLWESYFVPMLYFLIVFIFHLQNNVLQHTGLSNMLCTCEYMFSMFSVDLHELACTRNTHMFMCVSVSVLTVAMCVHALSAHTTCIRI